MLIVDDQALVRTGFRMILETEPGLSVVGEAADGHQAVAEARRLRPDIVLMDVRMPGLDGIGATRQIAADPTSLTRVVMLTTFDMDEYVYGALQRRRQRVPAQRRRTGVAGGRDPSRPRRRGAAGACGHPTDHQAFLQRPRTLDNDARRKVARPDRPRTRGTATLARGLTNAEIATELFVSETTVKTHVSRVLMKLGLRDRVQAVIFAYETGLTGDE